MTTASQYLSMAMKDLAGIDRGAHVLDFGCGKGALVADLTSMGFDAMGCDPWVRWDESNPRLKRTEDPYRFPFRDESFDAVVSTSVLEHVSNKEECFREMHRV